MTSPVRCRVRVLLADDHAVVRAGLKAVLRKAGFDVVGEASDGRAAIALCNTVRPDVAVLDVAMPLLNGIDAARDILKNHPNTRIVLLTMYTEESYVLAGLRAGVTGYVLKSNAVASLVHAVRAVSKDDMYLGLGVSQALVKACRADVPSEADPLSGRERQVLQLIAEGRTMKEIGAMLGISPRTAETHRTRIMHRLDVHDIASLVRYAIDCGLLRPPGQGEGPSDRSTPKACPGESARLPVPAGAV